MPKIAYIVQAREGSRRFPDKWMTKINGKYCIDMILNTISKSVHYFSKDQITFVVPKQDRRLIRFLKDRKIRIVHDYDRNVYQAFLEVDADIKVRMTADSPMIHWMEIDKNINMLKEGYKYAANEITKFGNACEAFWSDTLVRYRPESIDEEQHVTLQIRRNCKEVWIPSFMLDYPGSVKHMENDTNQCVYC